MSNLNSFRELIRRVRAGDDEAAAELVHCYEPTIRLLVRRRLTDPGLRRLLDSMDICQSILAGFFTRAASGQFELNSPEQLLKLLATMARNKLTSHARKQRAARRAGNRRPLGSSDQLDCMDRSPNPSQVVANRELLQEFRKRLSPEEMRVAELRAAGRSWNEIAAAMGDKPDALRMRFTRAIAWVARTMAIE